MVDETLDVRTGSVGMAGVVSAEVACRLLSGGETSWIAIQGNARHVDNKNVEQSFNFCGIDRFMCQPTEK